jgi:molybdopterin converting factor small subunit
MLTIEYTAQLRRAAGVASETVEIAEACTLQELARAIAARHGEELERMLVDSQGRLQRSILVFIGEEQIAPDSTAPLRDGQTITFAAPISGG